jgi:hypothetical protein
LTGATGARRNPLFIKEFFLTKRLVNVQAAGQEVAILYSSRNSF